MPPWKIPLFLRYKISFHEAEAMARAAGITLEETHQVDSVIDSPPYAQSSMCWLVREVEKRGFHMNGLFRLRQLSELEETTAIARFLEKISPRKSFSTKITKSGVKSPCNKIVFLVWITFSNCLPPSENAECCKDLYERLNDFLGMVMCCFRPNFLRHSQPQLATFEQSKDTITRNCARSRRKVFAR